MIIDISLGDFIPEVQSEILQAYGYKSANEGNFDILPLFELEIDDEETDT